MSPMFHAKARRFFVSLNRARIWSGESAALGAMFAARWDNNSATFYLIVYQLERLLESNKVVIVKGSIYFLLL
jgi:hypothetical protein